MKKALLSLMLIFSVVLIGTKLYANEETGNLVVHYQNTTGDYSNIGINTWGHDTEIGGGIKNPNALTGITKEDDFGIYWELNDVKISNEGSIGFQVVGFDAPDAKDPDWDNKKYANHEIQNSILKADKTVHVFLFPGSNTRTNNEATPEPIPYLYTNPDKSNIVLTYFDQSNAYDENLGLHHWGWDNYEGPGWADPAKILVNVGYDLAGTPIKGVVLEYDIKNVEYGNGDKTPGLIVYAGGDANKKTGDVKLSLLFSEESPLAAVGKYDVLQVFNDGDSNTSNENVIVNDAEEYIKNAYSFKFIDMFVDNGEIKGTFAPRPNQVIAELNTSVKIFDKENPDKELTEEEKVAIVKQWFTLKDKSGTSVVIDDVHFNKAAGSVNSFVLILKSNLDNKKEYNLTIDLGLDGDENKTDEIAVNMDTEGPKLTFISPASFAAEKDPTKRVILVAWNKKFDQNLFPRFIVTDDRDGDVTSLVYVPKGEFSKLNTNVEGDYTIMLRVSDSWGNVTEETFIFRVTRKVK